MPKVLNYTPNLNINETCYCNVVGKISRRLVSVSQLGRAVSVQNYFHLDELLPGCSRLYLYAIASRVHFNR